MYQHLEYFAFGGAFVEEHSNTNRTPYLFNGKELDEETGLYYYGARYYDEQTSIFLSVDPLAEKFPEWSPYAYAFNNPVRFVDPTGMEGVDAVTDPPTKEQEAAMAKSDNENGALSEKYAVRADRINDGKSTSTANNQQTGGNSEPSTQNGGCCPGDTDNFTSNAYEAAKMTKLWALGLGDEERSFTDDNVANAMRNAQKVNKARDFFYNQVNSGKKGLADGVSNYSGFFDSWVNNGWYRSR